MQKEMYKRSEVLRQLGEEIQVCGKCGSPNVVIAVWAFINSYPAVRESGLADIIDEDDVRDPRTRKLLAAQCMDCLDETLAIPLSSYRNGTVDLRSYVCGRDHTQWEAS